MHDTCGQGYLIDCCAKHTAKKKKSVGALTACHAAEISLEYFQIKGVKGEKVKKNTTFFFFYSPHCTLWWTLHKSHLCSAGGDSLLVRGNTETNISWDRKPLMMKCSSHRKQMSAGRHGELWHRRENALDNGGGLAPSHLAAVTCKQTNALTRVCTWCTNACHITSKGEKNVKNLSNFDVSVVNHIYPELQHDRIH